MSLLRKLMPDRNHRTEESINSFANYQKQREAFMALLNPDCEKRIMLFHGESGTGKTALIMTCKNYVCEPVYYVPIQLRNTVVNVAELFSRTGRLIGWNRFPNFTRKVARLNKAPDLKLNIQDNKQIGMDNMIKIAMTTENHSDRMERQVHLTEAWFEDINKIEIPILLAMDTYEQAATEMKEWVSGPFLYRAAYCNNIRVVIAGREVPESNNIEWGHCCDLHELYGVMEAEHWLPVVENLGRMIPKEPQLTYLEGICDALSGRPDAMMKIIQAFPRKQQLI